jgi:large subunit ribosomal protein L35
MSKIKSHRGASKRFRQRANGIKFRRANRNHILTKKSTKRKRNLRAQGQMKPCDVRAAERLLHGS